MAGFGFSEAQGMFRREVRNFAQKEFSQGAKERSKEQKLPCDIIQKLGGMGLLGINLPEEFGGQGLDWVSFGIGVEEVGKVDFFAGFYMTMPPLVCLCLQATALPNVRKEWIPPIIRGDKIVSFAVTEPDTGSDVSAIRTTATRDGDSYILNGEKTSITLGHESDVCMVFAKTDSRAGGKGITCFLVPLDQPGISRYLIPHSGWRPMTASSIIFDNVRIPAEYRCGEEGQGFRIFAASGADFMRPALSILAVALAQTSLDDAVSYTLQRTAFGKPIAKFEGVSFKIAEHETRLEAARLLCYRTFYLHDQGQPHTKESAMCKWWCPVVAFDSVHDAILIHGHVGYSEEYPLEQRLRDIMGFEFADGTAQIMKKIIAREIMGRDAAPH